MSCHGASRWGRVGLVHRKLRIAIARNNSCCSIMSMGYFDDGGFMHASFFEGPG
ncbi:hypothetical protein SFMTTN_1195 [Sulfuriferula multivorans]|uniref:Uncharacterized protein n=1 Tax=Sulfuriferula multivorans TaxID=1559896 RepID=A0A401JCI4_9PROT|nr:hypothetical protein SFMTTN_1195 [Sulfuriferula multivorans]